MVQLRIGVLVTVFLSFNFQGCAESASLKIAAAKKMYNEWMNSDELLHSIFKTIN